MNLHKIVIQSKFSCAGAWINVYSKFEVSMYEFLISSQS